MLSVTSYAQDYVDTCRARVQQQLDAYQRLGATVREHAGSAALDSALAEFEPVFFSNMVLSLDSYFCHRARTLELKDGNPCNEVRAGCKCRSRTRCSSRPTRPSSSRPISPILGDPRATRPALTCLHAAGRGLLRRDRAQVSVGGAGGQGVEQHLDPPVARCDQRLERRLGGVEADDVVDQRGARDPSPTRAARSQRRSRRGGR